MSANPSTCLPNLDTKRHLSVVKYFFCDIYWVHDVLCQAVSGDEMALDILEVRVSVCVMLDAEQTYQGASASSISSLEDSI